MIKAAIIQIYGRVQGVGFRYYTHQKANELGINGFVENRADGSVYIEAEAEEDRLDAFILWCHHGPQWAKVRELKIAPMPALGIKGFRVR